MGGRVRARVGDRGRVGVGVGVEIEVGVGVRLEVRVGVGVGAAARARVRVSSPGARSWRSIHAVKSHMVTHEMEGTDLARG